jgi:hypothetical protein
MKTPPPQSKLFPESKPLRVTVPISAEVHEAFQQLAAVQGCSVGRAMGEWMEGTLDGVQAMTQMLQKAKRSPREAVRHLNAYAVSISDLTESLLEDVRKLPMPSKAAAKGAGSRVSASASLAAAKPASRTARTPFTPPPGNTGGKVPKDKAKGRGSKA